jgi:hypothetical protein
MVGARFPLYPLSSPLLLVCVQMRTLLDDGTVSVVLQVEQVLHVLGHLSPSDAELPAFDM